MYAALSVENGIHPGGLVSMPCWSWCCSEGMYCTHARQYTVLVVWCVGIG